MAAVAHIPFQAFYSASKAAVSSYSCALDNEVSPYGVRVTAVELGDIHTGFIQADKRQLWVIMNTAAVFHAMSARWRKMS